MDTKQEVINHFKSLFGEDPAFVVRAPGRVNLIGEHTDYNDGFVLPMAINRAAYIALRPRQDTVVSLMALDFHQSIRFALDAIQKDQEGPAEYIKGVAWALQDAGYKLAGWEGVVKGDVPIGAGLSSSASLEMAVARAFAAVSGFEFEPPVMAQLGQRVENKWIGVNSGIMDQMISASGQANAALLIDCRSLETDAAPLPPDTVVVILDTGTRRGLVGSAYNERREQCEKAAAIFGVKALRDVSMADFEANAHKLEALTLQRARHVISENERTLAARDALQRGDAVAFGQLMNASHVSMRDDFEISSEALNAMVDCAQAHPACFGARMTGGGFAGCAVALVQKDAAEAFASHVETCYTATLPHTPQIYITNATQGADLVSA